MNGKNAIKRVAKKSGVCKKKVYQEIFDCIKIAKENRNPEIKSIWAKIPRKGNEITPEELIEYLAGQVKSELQKRQIASRSF